MHKPKHRSLLMGIGYLFMPILLVGNCSKTYASLAETVVLEVRLDLKGGQSVSGYLEWFGDADPACSAKEIKDALVLETIRQGGVASEGPDGDVPIYKTLYQLKYKPTNPQASGGESRGNAKFGFEDGEKQLVNRRKIEKLHISGCKETYSISPILELSKKQVELLQRPALALFSVDCYPEGNVSLVSYNPTWDTPKKLEALLRQFSSSITVDYRHDAPNCEDSKKGAPYWFPIYDNADKFRQEYEPQNLLLSIYHVPD